MARRGLKPGQTNAGSFKAGEVNNPKGRPKTLPEMQALAQLHSVAAVEKMARILEESADEVTILRAAELLLDRAWGKPSQPTELTGTLNVNAEDLRAKLLANLDRIRAKSDREPKPE